MVFILQNRRGRGILLALSPLSPACSSPDVPLCLAMLCTNYWFYLPRLYLALPALGPSFPAAYFMHHQCVFIFPVCLHVRCCSLCLVLCTGMHIALLASPTRSPAETAVFLEEIAVSQTPKRLQGLMRVGWSWAEALLRLQLSRLVGRFPERRTFPCYSDQNVTLPGFSRKAALPAR